MHDTLGLSCHNWISVTPDKYCMSKCEFPHYGFPKHSELSIEAYTNSYGPNSKPLSLYSNMNEALENIYNLNVYLKTMEIRNQIKDLYIQEETEHLSLNWKLTTKGFTIQQNILVLTIIETHNIEHVN